MTLFAAFVAAGSLSLSTMSAGQNAPPAAPATGKMASKVQQKIRARILAVDSDKDGRLSSAEFAAARVAKGSKRNPAKVFARLDMNRDGYLSSGEIDSLAAKRVARLDANHDGVVSREEREAQRAGAEDEQ